MYDCTQVILLVVRVPVLSEQIEVAFPIVSQASKWRTKLLSNIICIYVIIDYSIEQANLLDGIGECESNGQRQSFGNGNHQNCNSNYEEFYENLKILVLMNIFRHYIIKNPSLSLHIICWSISSRFMKFSKYAYSNFNAISKSLIRKLREDTYFASKKQQMIQYNNMIGFSNEKLAFQTWMSVKLKGFLSMT